MKPSELVDLSYKLHEFPVQQLAIEVTNVSNFAKSLVYDSEVVIKLTEKLTELEKVTNDLQSLLTTSISSVDTELIECTNILINNPYIRPPIEFERNERATVLTEEVENAVSVRIVQYTSWQHPVLEIGPGDGKWTRLLVSGDPLYLVDVHKDFLDSTIRQFNDVYRKKVRLYQIGSDVSKTDVDISALPTGQFGFIFAWNVFDYLPNGFINEYMKQCFALLKPGGVLMFSYNNCEDSLCAELAEKQFKSWMPKWKITELIDNIGFELITHGSTDRLAHWVEIKKPGELTSIRASQTLATVHVRDGYIPVDNEVEKVYNKQQISRLKQIAIQMNLGNPDDIMLDMYTPHQLNKMIEKARN